MKNSRMKGKKWHRRRRAKIEAKRDNRPMEAVNFDVLQGDGGRA